MARVGKANGGREMADANSSFSWFYLKHMTVSEMRFQLENKCLT